MAKKLKIVECISCGKEVEVSVFASSAKTKCDDCKGGNKVTTTMTRNENGFDGRKHGPRIDGPLDNDSLNRLCCPHHPDKPMTIIGVIKSDWGDQITYQCREKGCYTVVQISEQSTMPLRTRIHGIGFEIDDVFLALQEHKGLRKLEERYNVANVE